MLTRRFVPLLASLLLCATSGCYHNCCKTGPGCCGLFGGRCNPGMYCGDGCGKPYWHEWYCDPPDCCDPCDCCGHWTGCASHCGQYAGCGGPYWGPPTGIPQGPMYGGGGMMPGDGEMMPEGGGMMPGGAMMGKAGASGAAGGRFAAQPQPPAVQHPQTAQRPSWGAPGAAPFSSFGSPAQSPGYPRLR